LPIVDLFKRTYSEFAKLPASKVPTQNMSADCRLKVVDLFKRTCTEFAKLPASKVLAENMSADCRLPIEDCILIQKDILRIR